MPDFLVTAQPKAAGHHAHHIVAAGSRYARKAQTILARCGVKPNSSRNGIFLPGKDAVNVHNRPRHNHIHTQNYYHNVNEIIQASWYGSSDYPRSDAERCNSALKALDQIKLALERNAFPY
jgi:hypothetical protein